eukprot:1919670-Pleurochrysis_carterae.AAC.1
MHLLATDMSVNFPIKRLRAILSDQVMYVCIPHVLIHIPYPMRSRMQAMEYSYRHGLWLCATDTGTILVVVPEGLLKRKHYYGITYSIIRHRHLSL